MVFQVSILVKQILHNKTHTRFKFVTRSHIILQSALKGDYADIVVTKTDGFRYSNAQIARIESSLVKYIFHNYGPGEYSLLKCAGGRKGMQVFWRGRIEQTRFIRFKGSLSPYLFSIAPIKRWHDLRPKVAQ